MAAQRTRFEADKNLAALGFCCLNLVRWADDAMTWVPSTAQVTQQEIATENRLVVHCWATWNATDCVLDEKLQWVREEFRDSATFRSCDVDNPNFIATLRSWNILNVPALVLLESGRTPLVRYGATSESDLALLLRERLHSSSPT